MTYKVVVLSLDGDTVASTLINSLSTASQWADNMTIEGDQVYVYDTIKDSEGRVAITDQVDYWQVEKVLDMVID